jgi:uncharacterized repeat protein (TIGR02543 family)
MKMKPAFVLALPFLVFCTRLSAQTPTITNINPASGLTVPGATVTITGTNFNTTATNNIVRFGAVKAIVSAATATSLTVTAPVGATFGPVTALNTALARAGTSLKPFLPTFAGKGSFTANDMMAAVEFNPIAQCSTYVAVGDLDGDGKLDLVTANACNNTISVFRNISVSGTIDATSFASKVDFATGSSPNFLAIGDLDGDGKLDLAVANFGGSTVSVFRNTSASGVINASSFAAKVDFATGTNPIGLAIGDLDGDGKPDLVTANQNGNSLSVLRNTSASGTITSGSFAAGVDFAMVTGSFPRSVAIGDLDGDGKPDLAVGNFGANTVSVFRNTSSQGIINTGSFAAQVNFATATSSRAVSVAIGDLDGDGKPDLAVANSYTSPVGNAVSVLRNTSSSGSITTASFAAKVDLIAATRSTSVAIGDLDGDGKPDLVVTNNSGGGVSVCRNVSSSGVITSASFSTNIDFTVGDLKMNVVIGDLDGDGKPDIVGTKYVFNATSSPNIYIFRNNPSALINFNANGGTGSMASQRIYLAVTDLMANAFTRTGYNFAGWNTAANGTGTSYSNSQGYAIGATDVTLYAQWLLPPPTITSISPATGLTVPGATVTITGTKFNTTAANNIVRFGAAKATVTAATATSLTVTAPAGATYAPVTALNANLALSGSSPKPFLPTFAGKGSFTANDIMAKVDFATGTISRSVAIGDLDGDGKPDLAVANYEAATVSVFRNTSVSGSITSSSFAAKVDFATGVIPCSIAIGDVDGDGKPDLVVANAAPSNSVSVLRNTSVSGSIDASSFAPKVDFATGADPISVAFGDLDGDGKPDLAAANFSSNSVSVLRNTSVIGSIDASSFALKVDFATGTSTNPYTVAIGDLDEDGKPDLAVANYSSASVSVFRNTSVIGGFTASSFATSVTFGTGQIPMSVAIGDLDGDGKSDLAVACTNSSVSVLRNTSVSGSISASSFAAKVDFATGVKPRFVAIGDLDGDGKPDLALTILGGPFISVLRNTSVSGSITASSFAAKVDFNTGISSPSLAIGDIDSDGKPDLAVANFGSPSVSVLRNNPSAFVTFNANGGTGSMANQQISYLASANLTANAFTRTGYNFAGWNTVAAGTGTSYANSASYTMGASDVTLYAKWTANTLTVTYNSQLGSAIASGTTTTGASISASPGTPTRTGYTFNGWFAATTGGTAITFPYAHGQTANFTLYAQWTANTLTVTYNSQLGSAIASGTTTTGTSIAASPGTPTRAGYTFNGWFAATTGGTAITFPYAHGQTANFTLYAQWTINNYNITFNGNGTTGGSMSAQSITYLASANLTANAFTRIGSTFFRWNTAADGTGTAYTNSASYTMGASNVTLYAQWLLIPPVITSISPASGTTVPGTTVTITGTNFNPTAVNNTVRFGAVKATVTAASATSLTVTAPLGATYAPVTVLNTGMPLSGSSSKPFLPTFAGKGSLTVNDILPKVDFATTGTQQPYYVAIGDIDGDGKPDLAVANYANGTVSVYHNTSTSGTITTASFAARVDFATGANPISVVIGDLNGDGKPELAVTNNGSASVSVFRNTASSGSITTASFAAKVDFTVGTNPRSVAIVDLDGDGKADLAVANTAVFTVSILRNTSVSGTISFLPKMDYASGANPHFVAFGDLDGDGKPDLATANNGNASVSVLRNNSIAGTISLEAKVDFTAGTAPVSLAIGDLDADGKAEMVVTNFGNAGVSVFKNNAVSGFITSTSFDAKVDFTTGTGAWSVAIGDLDGDGKPDLAVANTGVTRVSVLRNTSTASSITASSFAAKVDFATATGTRSVAIGDLDLDGKPDFVAANYNNATISVFRNNPSAFVRFNANVGTGTMANQQISYLASANLTANTFTRTGYTFTGWNTAADGTGTSYANLASYTMGASDVTLFAQWSINDYTITYDGNGSDGGSMSAQTITYLASANLTPNGFSRTGYVFFGWNTEANGTGSAFANLASYTMGASDVTLYAQWVICTWTGASNGNWNDAANWNANEVPTGGIDVVIPAGTVNAISTGGSFSSKSVTIQAGATVGINSGGVWNIVGNLQGAAGSVISGTGKVVLNGSSAQTISGTVSVSNLEINNSAVQITSGSSLSILPTVSSPNALLTLLSGSSLTNNGNLILRSNSFGTGSIGPIPANATLGGNITQERLLPSTKGWYFVGAPFKSGTALSEWSELNPRISPKLNGTLFEYSESDSSVGVASEVNGWKVPNTLASAINPLNQPKGYRIYVGVSNPTRLISATGLPFTQDVVSPLTFSPLTGYGGGGWNLISNPYPCAINWNQMRNDASNSGQSLSNAYYTWNGTAGNYGSYTSLGAGTGVGVGGLQESISSSQAFFVKAMGAANLTFKESFKNTGAASSSFLRTATNDLEFLKFKVQQGINWDEAGVLFYPGAEEGEDIYDALNLMGSAVDVAMVMTGGKNASIGVLPAIGDQRVIPLKVRTPSNGQATFHFEGIDHFSPMIQLYLKDEYLGTLTDIRQHPDVSFESVAAQSYNRFSLVLLTINLRVETENVDKKALRIFPNPAQNKVTVFSPVAGNLTIFNALGQKVETRSVVSGQNHLDISRLPQGMYWIKMQGMAEEKLVVE